MRKRVSVATGKSRRSLSLPLSRNNSRLTLGVSNRPSLPLSSPTPSMSVATAEHIRARASGVGWSSGGGSIGEEGEAGEAAVATPAAALSSSDDSEEDAAEPSAAAVSKIIFGAACRGFEGPSAACRGAEAEEPILREESRERQREIRKSERPSPSSFLAGVKNWVFFCFPLVAFVFDLTRSINFPPPRLFLRSQNSIPTMTLPNSSSALVWQIVKKTNAFAVRGRTGDRPRFSRERGNLMSLHSFKHSGKELGDENERKRTRSPGFSSLLAGISSFNTRERVAWPLSEQHENNEESRRRPPEGLTVDSEWVRLGRRLPVVVVRAGDQAPPRLFLGTRLSRPLPVPKSPLAKALCAPEG